MDVLDAADLSGGVLELALMELLRCRLLRPQVIPNPGAGVELAIAAPGDATWELVSLRLTFVASAVVANRHPSLVLADPDGKEYLRIDPQLVVAAAGQIDVNFAAGLGYVQAANPTLFGLPGDPFRILPGWTLKTSTALLDVGDAYSNVRLIVREWEEHRTLEQTRWLLDHLR
jgi:hypothetical protein